MNNRQLLALSLLFGAASLLPAQTPAGAGSADPAARPPAGLRVPSVIFMAVDANRDGVISESELAAAPTGLFALDLNEDGVLTADELRAFVSRAPAGPRHPTDRSQSRFAGVSPGFLLAYTLDANHDGVIQTTEIANAELSLKALDANGDGELTAADLQAYVIASQGTSSAPESS